MGGVCAKQNRTPNPYAGRSTFQGKESLHKDVNKVAVDEESVQQSSEKQMEGKESPRSPVSARYSNASDDEFYDGIPQYHRSFYRKSRSLRGAKVAEVSSLLGRAGSVGLERAAEVLDSLSSVTNLNIKGAFVSGPTAKNNELGILAFEVANTIVKGSNLMQSLSSRSIRQLKEVVLPEDSVQHLISEDMDELLRIVAADKREELKVFSGEVVRFGNRCKDPQWHNLDRFFEKRSKDRTPQKQLMETAESVMTQLMTLVQHTADLYQELHKLDKIEEDYQRKRLEELRKAANRGDRDNSVTLLSGKLKSQRKVVKTLKKKSLWSRTMEEVMEKLVDIALYLNQEINHTFGNPEVETPENEKIKNQQKLGPAGLALHYANIILQIDAIVARSSSMALDARDILYQSLPPNIRDSLRPKLQSFHVEKELRVTEIKDEMEKTLRWLVPIATNTIKAHHGFGWVGEWGNTVSEQNRRATGPMDVMPIETLHHADKQKAEAYILDLLMWLNYLVSRSKARGNQSGPLRPPFGSLSCSPSKKANQNSTAKDNEELVLEENNEEKTNEDELVRTEARPASDGFVHLEKSLDAIDRL